MLHLPPIFMLLSNGPNLLFRSCVCQIYADWSTNLTLGFTEHDPVARFLIAGGSTRQSLCSAHFQSLKLTLQGLSKALPPISANILFFLDLAQVLFPAWCPWAPMYKSAVPPCSAPAIFPHACADDTEQYTHVSLSLYLDPDVCSAETWGTPQTRTHPDMGGFNAN